MSTLQTQRCPVCEGAGCVVHPPHVPVGQAWSDNQTGPYSCRACNGRGYLLIGNATDGRANVIVLPPISESHPL